MIHLSYYTAPACTTENLQAIQTQISCVLPGSFYGDYIAPWIQLLWLAGLLLVSTMIRFYTCQDFRDIRFKPAARWIEDNYEEGIESE